MPKLPEQNEIFKPVTQKKLDKFRQGFAADMARSDEIQRQLRIRAAQIRQPLVRSSLDITINVQPRVR